MTEHKHAWVLRELADGASIDDYEICCGGLVWDDLCHYETPLITGKGEIRRKPKMIRIYDVEFPEPVREPLVDGTKYFVASITSKEFCSNYEWYDGALANRWLERGLIHLTEAAAKQHAEALTLLSGGGV